MVCEKSPNGCKTIQSKRRGLQMKTKTTKKLTVSEKYRQLKAQTEAAGMKVEEVDGKIVVKRKAKKK